MMKIKIEGMMCQHCVGHVTEALKNINGLSDINVSLEEKCATVSGNVDPAVIKAAIEEEGYDVVGIE
ncbi:MAG: heavy-metal-associated domain-containing protein [Schwartzia sp.]|nr:heavy-metal-associated domain-containing protein [Schwartzia sp. (in: firmicutes)]